jgi:opacity protein-like surface antigen
MMALRLGASLAAAAMLAAPVVAAADPDLPPEHAGPYLALDLGYHWPLTIDAHSLSPAPDGQRYEWLYTLNSDWDAFGRAGWRFSPHFRVELDTGLREGNIHSITSPGTGLNGLSAQRPQTPFQLCDLTNAPPPCAKIGRPHINWDYADDGMINAIYDIAPNRRLDPFVGFGVGIYHLQFDGHYFFSAVPGPFTPTNPPMQTIQLGGSINRLTQAAYQAVGGVSYRLKRKLWFDVTYRYISAPVLRWNTLNDTPGLTQSQGLEPHDMRGDSQDMSVTFGLRYALR